MTRLGIVVAALCAAVALAVPASASALERPSPGALGIGDRLFPTLGNGGYDVLHYDLDLRYATAAPSQGIDGDGHHPRARHAVAFALRSGLRRRLGRRGDGQRPAGAVRPQRRG